MKLETYTARQVPDGQGPMVHALGGEQARALTVPDTAGMVAGAASRTADALGDVAARLARARQLDQVAEAQIAAREGFAGIAERFSDPAFLAATDPADFEARFTEASDGLWEKIGEKTTDPDVRRAVEKDFAAVRLSQLVNVRQQARTAQIDRGRAGTLQQLDRMGALLLKADRAADTAGLADVLGQAQALMAGKAAAGYFTRQEAIAEMERFRQRTGATMWARRIVDNPKAAMEALAEPLDDIDEDTRLRLFERAQNTYESVLRTQIQLADKRERDAEKALKKSQEAVAGQFWLQRASGQTVDRMVLDEALRGGRIELSEYKALVKADDAVVDDPATIIGIEKALDARDQDKARALTYRGAEDGRIKAATAATYLGRIRGDDTSPLRGSDYTRAKQVVSMLFKQDGLLPDTSLHDRYAQASIEMDSRVIKGEKPLSVMADIYRRESGSVTSSLPADFTGNRDRAGLEAYQQTLTRQLQAKQIEEKTYRARYRMVQDAIDALDRNEQVRQMLDILQKYGAK